MPDIVRVLVPVDAEDAEAWRLALGYARKIGETAAPAVSDVMLLVHTKQQLDHTSLSRFLGAATLKALSKGPIALPWGARFHAETMRTLRAPPRNAVLIVYYAEPKILDFADGLQHLAGVVAVPDIAGDADGWVSRWGAHVHGQAAQAPAVLIDDPVFVRALEALTTAVNLSTGLLHPRDKATADETLRILRANGHRDQSATIKSWAIRRGWRPDGAAALETLAHKIWSLKGRPSLSAIPNAEERYQHWLT